LAVNKFGDYISIAHAALTAEGDNRVLMVKIVKDMITRIKKLGKSLPMMKRCPFRDIKKQDNIVNLEILLDLLKFREIMLYTQLDNDNKKLIQQEKKTPYQALMHETSDVMQDLAQAYGERNCLEYCIANLPKLKNKANLEIMTKVYLLFGAEIINRDLTFYILQGVLSQKALKSLTPIRHQLIKDIALQASDLLDCLNIPKHALYAPIAKDYVKYNASKNMGEVIGAKM